MLTEKGKELLQLILTHYEEDDTFTCAELKETLGRDIAPATLTGIAKDGYLIKSNTKPIKYSLATGAQAEYQRRKPKLFNPYSLDEYKQQEQLTYSQLCKLLIDKYGIVDGDYFCTEDCISSNPKIKRGKEGLSIHHIKEDAYIMLSTPQYAVKAPFEFQKGCNLVYCNEFEHLLLHMKIVTEWQNTITHIEDKIMLPGIGGVINHIAPMIDAKYKINGGLICNIKEKDFKKIMKCFFKEYTSCRMCDCVSVKEIKDIYNTRADQLLLTAILQQK